VKRLSLALAAIATLCSSCFLSSSSSGSANELTTLANKVSKTTYAAVYQFAFEHQPAPGETDRLEITQVPPTTVRQLQQSTRNAENKTISLKSWYITRAGGSYSCTEYPESGVRCAKDPVARTTFGSAKFDVYFDAPREEGSFASVRKISRSDRIAGQQATCFETAPAAPSPAAGAAVPSEGRFRYTLCYASDGILLRGQRTSLDETSGAQSNTFVQAISVSRVVEPGELRLPGPVSDASELGR
jgi:hypothetical protein